jgi:molecular chaperone GrpE
MAKKRDSEAEDSQPSVPDENLQDRTDEAVSENQVAGPEEPAEEPTEPQTEQLCEEDRLRLKVLELEDKLLRTAAEFENYRKRMARQYEDMVRSANDAVFQEFLEVVDNLERAVNHSNENADIESLQRGTELILGQMTGLLRKYDVTPIEAVGAPFDPNLHEAMMQVNSDEYEEGMVAVELSRGYRQGQRVIRHSKVGVSTDKQKRNDK